MEQWKESPNFLKAEVAARVVALVGGSALSLVSVAYHLVSAVAVFFALLARATVGQIQVDGKELADSFAKGTTPEDLLMHLRKILVFSIDIILFPVVGTVSPGCLYSLHVTLLKVELPHRVKEQNLAGDGSLAEEDSSPRPAESERMAAALAQLQKARQAEIEKRAPPLPFDDRTVVPLPRDTEEESSSGASHSRSDLLAQIRNHSGRLKRVEQEGSLRKPSGSALVARIMDAAGQSGAEQEQPEAGDIDSAEWDE